MIRRFLLWLFPSKHHLRVDWETDTHDTSYMILETAFEGLRRYVEIEKALIYVTVHPEEKGPRWWNHWWWSSPELGIKRLREEEGFLVDGQPGITSVTATEILALYDWWINRRKTLNDIQSHFLDVLDVEHLMATEEEQHAKDNEMFLRLAEIRDTLVS